MAIIYDLFQNKGLGLIYKEQLDKIIKKLSELARETPGEKVIIHGHLGQKIITVVSPEGKNVYYGKNAEPLESLQDEYITDLEVMIKEFQKINFLDDVKRAS